MSATYPKAIKTFTTKKNYTMDVMAEDVNDLQDEVMALESILGVNPHLMDSSDVDAIVTQDVNARLSALESGKTRPVFSMWENTVSTVAKDILKYIPFPQPVAGNDPFNWYNGVNGFLIKQTGWYHITGYTVWRANGASGFRRLGIYSNSSLLAAADFQGTLTYTSEKGASAIALLPAGTQIRLGAFQSTSVAQSTGGSKISGVFLRGV